MFWRRIHKISFYLAIITVFYFSANQLQFFSIFNGTTKRTGTYFEITKERPITSKTQDLEYTVSLFFDIVDNLFVVLKVLSPLIVPLITYRLALREKRTMSELSGYIPLEPLLSKSDRNKKI